MGLDKIDSKDFNALAEYIFGKAEMLSEEEQEKRFKAQLEAEKQKKIELCPHLDILKKTRIGNYKAFSNVSDRLPKTSVYIHGDTGMGKTVLIKALKELADYKKVKNYYFDELSMIQQLKVEPKLILQIEEKLRYKDYLFIDEAADPHIWNAQDLFKVKEIQPVYFKLIDIIYQLTFKKLKVVVTSNSPIAYWMQIDPTGKVSRRLSEIFKNNIIEVKK